jgi:hypothetical protein
MHRINAEFATAVRGICADFQYRCAEFRKFPRGFRLALAITIIVVLLQWHSLCNISNTVKILFTDYCKLCEENY